MKEEGQTLRSALFGLSKNLYFRELCRGDHRSPAEKRSFSDFPKENKRVFALRRQILLRQNLRAINDRPYNYLF